MSDWPAISRGAGLNIPEESLVRIAPTLDALHAAFRALTPKIPHTTEPAVVLSEPAVEGR